jgi:hypothetical protein
MKLTKTMLIIAVLLRHACSLLAVLVCLRLLAVLSVVQLTRWS